MEDFFALIEVHLKEVWGFVEVLDDGQLDAQKSWRKYRHHTGRAVRGFLSFSQSSSERSLGSFGSDEERSAGKTTKVMEEPRQVIPDEEPPVTTNMETTTVSKEQPPGMPG